MDERKLAQLEKLSSLLDEYQSGGITPEEIAEVFKVFIQIIADLKLTMQGMMDGKGREMEMRLSGVSNYIRELENKSSSSLTESEKRLLKKLSDEVSGVKKLIPPKTDLSPLEREIRRVDSKPLVGEKIVEAINASEATIKRERVEGLDEELKAIRALPRGGSGGGVSAMGVRQAFKYIAHTEEPTGDIDGVNTTYTVQNDIFYIFGFTLNGEQIAEIPNFTYAGKTITFGTALPAAYSGKDFEVKYIG